MKSSLTKNHPILPSTTRRNSFDARSLLLTLEALPRSWMTRRPDRSWNTWVQRPSLVITIAWNVPSSLRRTENP